MINDAVRRVRIVLVCNKRNLTQTPSDIHTRALVLRPTHWATFHRLLRHRKPEGLRCQGREPMLHPRNTAGRSLETGRPVGPSRPPSASLEWRGVGAEG